MTTDNDCAFCLQPIVTKTRSTTHFTYRCGHVFHTRCVAAFVYGSDADVTLKFRCIMCRMMQSTWFPTRLKREMAIQCTHQEEAMKLKNDAVNAFFECAYVNSFMPGRVGFGTNLEMVKIPEGFDVALCAKNISIAILGMVGKKSFDDKAHFEFATGAVIRAVTNYIDEREQYTRNDRTPIHFDDFNAVLTTLFPF